jgi:multidrug transporter EmrE-like cation transporter
MALVFIFITVTFTVIGQILVKKGMLEVGSSPPQLSSLPPFMWRTFTNLNVVGGLAAAVIAAISWTLAISRSELSFAYPFMGLPIVLVLALSSSVFGEAIIVGRWIGVAIVCLGLVIAASSQ